MWYCTAHAAGPLAAALLEEQTRRSETAAMCEQLRGELAEVRERLQTVTRELELTLASV